MRQGQNSKRSRGRGSGRRNVPPRHQTFDSNGPSVRIRGSAYQVHEKYLALARDAGSAGDRIAAENYLQHAEHYFRIINMDSDGDSQRGGRGQQNGYGGRNGPGRDGLDGPDTAAGAGGEATDGVAAAPPNAAPVQTNGADPQPDTGADPQPDTGAVKPDNAEADVPAPKRKAARGSVKGRRTRAASKTGDSSADDASAGPNGADASGGDVPPAEE